MQFEEKIRVKAIPEEVFSIYKNVSEWSNWDPDVYTSSISGEFITGSLGKLKPSKGPAAKIKFTEITENKSFTTISKLPLCTMTFEHQLTSIGEETEVIHKVSFSGLLSPLFGRLIGTSIKKGLPATLQGLKNKIESKN